MGQFAVALQKFAEKVDQRANDVVKGITMEIAARIEDRSPVDTGFFRANWQLTLDAPATGTVALGSAGLQGALPDRVLGHVIYYTNNTAYGRRLEFGFTGTDSLGRSYNQPPRGFVALTVLELEEIAAEVVAKVTGSDA